VPALVKDYAPPDKRAARRSFERAARHYDAAAPLHREIGKRLLEHLDPMRIDPARVLDLGCGTGAFLDSLGKRFPRAELVGLDLAHAMLIEARRRTGWWRRAVRSRSPRLVCADAERLPLAAGSIDFIFSNLALQWCRAEGLFAEAARALSTGGLILFASFGPDTLKELRAAFAAADRARHVHTFIDMHDLGDALVHAGFADPVMEMEVVTVEYSTVAALADDLKATGARNALAGRPRGLTGVRVWKRMVEHYETQRRNGTLPATYEVIYGHAWRAAPRRSADGRQVIDFHPRDGA
jgi:malonyl-CoA O-methyltransferase